MVCPQIRRWVSSKEMKQLCDKDVSRKARQGKAEQGRAGQAGAATIGEQKLLVPVLSSSSCFIDFLDKGKAHGPRTRGPQFKREGYSWGLGDSDPKVRKTQDDLCSVPLSQTSGHMTAAFVQPNGGTFCCR